jgi:hypothetical protein
MARGPKEKPCSSLSKQCKSTTKRNKDASKRAPSKAAGRTGDKTATDIKSLARGYAAAAIKELARLSVEAQSESARVSAIDKILDRAYGPIRTIAGNKEKPMEIVVGVSASLDAKLDRIAHGIAAGSAQS